MIFFFLFFFSKVSPEQRGDGAGHTAAVLSGRPPPSAVSSGTRLGFLPQGGNKRKFTRCVHEKSLGRDEIRVPGSWAKRCRCGLSSRGKEAGAPTPAPGSPGRSGGPLPPPGFRALGPAGVWAERRPHLQTRIWEFQGALWAAQVSPGDSAAVFMLWVPR